jgi:hypothetical protein
MRRHTMLMGMLCMFTLGILFQLYSVFNPSESYSQQMAFMLIAMPSVLAIINEYYYHQPTPCIPADRQPEALPRSPAVEDDDNELDELEDWPSF